VSAFVIRPAIIDDDRALAELDAAAWPLELQVTPPRPATDPFFAGRRDVDDVIVAEKDAGVVGYAHIVRHMPIAANAHVLHLNSLAISPSARGLGLAHQLVEATIAEARHRGARKLGLRALSNNPRAIHIYENHGFELEGRIREEMRLPDGSYADDLWYGLFL
jgi:ribosomal protein S18 acetylase RimI-like enzyme